MYKTVEATYDNGVVKFPKKLSFPNTKVLVTFLPEVQPKKINKFTKNGFTPEYEKNLLAYVNSEEYKNEKPKAYANAELLIADLKKYKKK